MPSGIFSLIFFLAAITKFTPDIPLTSLLLMCFSHIRKLQLSLSSSSGQRPSYSPSFISHTWVYMKEQVLYFDLHHITRLQLLFTVLDFFFWFWWNSLYPSYLPQRMTRTPGWNRRKSIWRHLRAVSASRTCLTKSSENRDYSEASAKFCVIIPHIGWSVNYIMQTSKQRSRELGDKRLRSSLELSLVVGSRWTSELGNYKDLMTQDFQGKKNVEEWVWYSALLFPTKACVCSYKVMGWEAGS